MTVAMMLTMTMPMTMTMNNDDGDDKTGDAENEDEPALDWAAQVIEVDGVLVLPFVRYLDRDEDEMVKKESTFSHLKPDNLCITGRMLCLTPPSIPLLKSSLA